MVWQREVLGFSLQKVATNLGLDPSTVSRVVSQFQATASMGKRPYLKYCRPNKKLSKTVQFAVLPSALQHPGIYLRELQTEVLVLTGVHVSASSLCTFLRESKFTRQRMRIVARQQDKFLREQFAVDVCLYEPYMLVFVDETGSDCRDALRKYGYGLRGSHQSLCMHTYGYTRREIINCAVYRFSWRITEVANLY